MSKLSAYLLPILRLKVQGYTNDGIADELGYAPSTVETYAKRIIQFFKDEGMWDPRVSPKTGLIVCGQRYLEMLVSSASLGDIDSTVINSTGAYQASPQDGAQASSVWTVLPSDQLEATLRRISPEPYEIGSRYILLGNRLYRDWLCEEAIRLFQTAESILGRTSQQAVKAACRTAQMYLELGDLDKAKEEITHTQQTYGAVIDLEMTIELQHLNGWIDYARGNLHQAESWYRQSLDIAEQTGMEQLGKHAYHFLGCIYGDWGRMSDQKDQANEWYAKAEAYLDKAYQIHLAWGDDGDQGYDLLRKAVIWRAQKRWKEAQQLRARARHLFSTELSYLNIDLEETKIALKQGNERDALFKVEQILEGWAEVKNTKGISDALQTVGLLKQVQGKLAQAIEYHVAALCLYPYENHPDKRRVWSDISAIIGQEKGTIPQQQLDHIQESIQAKQDAFVYLKHITVERSADIAYIMRKLGSLVC